MYVQNVFYNVGKTELAQRARLVFGQSFVPVARFVVFCLIRDMYVVDIKRTCIFVRVREGTPKITGLHI